MASRSIIEDTAPSRPAGPSRRVHQLLAGSAMAIALTGHAGLATAQSGEGGGLQLPTLSVEGAGQGGSTDYKVDQPGLQKLTEPLRDTPQTINVVPQQLMKDQGVTTLRDALRDVPGISLAAGEFGAQGDNLTIRGFTARNDIYLDGMRDFGSYYRDPFDLEEIEVLKGPSSILFGRGSTGGVINQVTKTPQLAPFINGSLSFGTDLTKRATADVNEPVPSLGQGAAFRVNMEVTNADVAGRDVTENTRIGFAPSLALGLGTPTRINLNYLHQTEYDTPDYGVPWLYAGVPGQGVGLARPAPVPENSYYGFANSDFLRTNVDIISAAVEHDLDEAVTLHDEARYAHYIRSFRITEPQIYGPAALGATGTSILITPGTPLSSLLVSRNQLYGSSLETYLGNQADVTAKLGSGFIRHAVNAGIELGQETSSPVRFTTIGPYSTTPLLSPDPSQTYNANSYLASQTNTRAYTAALYLLDTVKLGEQWEVMGGVRLDRFDASYRQIANDNPVTGTGAANVSLRHIDEMASWRGGIVYKPTTEGSVYFSHGTSFDPSAEALALSAANANLAPEKNKTYEVGTKWNLLHDNLAVSAAVYQSEKTNLKETDPNNSAFMILAGNAVAKGAELQAVGRLTQNWQVQAGYAYTFSEIVSSPQNDLGHRLGNVPMHTANLWTTYKLPWKIEVGGGANYVSSRFAATTPTKAGGVLFWKEAPGYWTLSAMARYPLNDHMDVQVNLANLTDAYYADQLHPSHVVPGPGRSALFTVNFKY